MTHAAPSMFQASQNERKACHTPEMTARVGSLLELRKGNFSPLGDSERAMQRAFVFSNASFLDPFHGETPQA
jgi:hypothetical protein